MRIQEIFRCTAANACEAAATTSPRDESWLGRTSSRKVQTGRSTSDRKVPFLASLPLPVAEDLEARQEAQGTIMSNAVGSARVIYIYTYITYITYTGETGWEAAARIAREKEEREGLILLVFQPPPQAFHACMLAR